MVEEGKKDEHVDEKYDRRLDNIEKKSQDYGRYGREPKTVPPKPLESTETMQSEGEIREKETQNVKSGQSPDASIDVVCGKEISSGTSPDLKAEHNHREYRFCSKDCLELFLKSPESYIKNR